MVLSQTSEKKNLRTIINGACLFFTFCLGAPIFAEGGIQKSSIEIGLPGLPSELNPANVGTLVQWTLLYNLSDRLVEGGLDGVMKPGIAKSWQVNKQNSTIDFVIHEDRNFSDGTPITTEDVIESFKFHYRLNGSTKFRIKEYLKKCNQDVGTKCDSLEALDTHRVRFYFQPGKLPDIHIFGIADFGIFPKKQLNKPLEALFAVTSGPFVIEKKAKNLILLKPNPFHPKQVSRSIKIVEVASEDLTHWVETEPLNRVIRVPNWGTALKISSDSRSAISAPFFIRMGFIPSFSKIGHSLELRNQIRQNLITAIEKATTQKIGTDLLPPFKRASRASKDLSKISDQVISENLHFIINTFSFTAEAVKKLEYSLKQLFPSASFELFATAGDFLTRIKNKNFDVGVAQMSFGQIDPFPSLQYMRLVWFQNALPKTILDQIDALSAPIEKEERLQKFEKLSDDFDTNSILFGLGTGAAQFIYPATLAIDSNRLISGEFDFTIFASKK